MSKPTVISNTGRTIAAQALKRFEASLFGELILAGNQRYEQARRSWNGIVDARHPQLIVRCARTSDVAYSVDFARNNQLAIAVRAGGHSLAADSFCDGGMLIDVSRMKNIAVDPATKTARAEAGLTAGEFDRATQAFGLATVMGECSSVGIAGYTLGGGLGRLMGQHGAACDNLLSVELVGANGQVVRASAEENRDLFWAIRGGGGNFGIVTSFEYRLHPAEQILGGTLTYPISDTREVLAFLSEYMKGVPDEFDIVIDIGNSGLMPSAPGIRQPIVNLLVSYCGDLERGRAALEPLRKFRRSVVDRIQVMPYLEMQALSDVRPVAEFGSSGGMMTLESGFVQQLDIGVIDSIVDSITKAPASFWIAAEHYLHGAVCRPAPGQTAFALRNAGYSTRIFSAWRESNQAEASVEWVRSSTEALKPFAGGAMYMNYLTGSEGNAGVRTAYGSNYERLSILKRNYDPDNFFKSNRNIDPHHDSLSMS